MKKQIKDLMLKHGMAVYDTNYEAVAACVNDVLEQTAVRLDEKAEGYDAFAHSAHMVRAEKINPHG